MPDGYCLLTERRRRDLVLMGPEVVVLTMLSRSHCPQPLGIWPRNGYAGANHTHLTELLREREGIDLSRPTVRRTLQLLCA